MSKFGNKVKFSSAMVSSDVHNKLSTTSVNYVNSNKKISEKMLLWPPAQDQVLNKSTETTNMLKLLKIRSAADPRRELAEEDLAEEEILDENLPSVNNIRSFKSRFNFSERKGNKLHPDDFNTLKGFDGEVG